MRLRVVNALVYLAFTVFAVASIAGPLGASARAFVRPWSHAPTLGWPGWWLALAATLALVVFDVARRLAAGTRVGLPRFVVLLFTAVACLASRQALPERTRPDPTLALAHLVARTELVADEIYLRDRTYPTDPDLLARDFPDELVDLGYFTRGASRLRARVVVVPGATEPVLRAPEGVRPGDVVFAIDESRQRFWITAFVLDARGRVATAQGEGGRALVASGAHGRAASRLDSLFPEYPHRAPRDGVPPTRTPR